MLLLELGLKAIALFGMSMTYGVIAVMLIIGTSSPSLFVLDVAKRLPEYEWLENYAWMTLCAIPIGIYVFAAGGVVRMVYDLRESDGLVGPVFWILAMAGFFWPIHHFRKTRCKDTQEQQVKTAMSVTFWSSLPFFFAFAIWPKATLTPWYPW